MKNKGRSVKETAQIMQSVSQLATLYNSQEGCPKVYLSSLPGTVAHLHTLPVFQVWQDGNSILPEMAKLPRPEAAGSDLLPFIYQLSHEAKLLVDALIHNGLLGTALEVGFARGGVARALAATI